ncbi:MAG: hypothetical protein NC548_55845, partial [Lachnospiraceae bacterium]|nr:hypothetical protein [Lachnospiraceae bacterium]
ILFFTDLKNEDKVKKIYNIIYRNYNLSTELLREEFNKCTSKNIISSDFEDIIEDGCKCLEKALGYTKTKLSKQQKEISKTVIYSDMKFKNSGTIFILFYTLMLSLFFVIMLLLKKYYILLELTEKQVETIEIFLVFMIFILISLKIFKALSKK